MDAPTRTSSQSTPEGSAVPERSASGRTVFEIQGRRLELPMHIPAAEAFGGVFTADAAAVRRRLPAGLAPVLLRPGRALVLVLAVRYLDNPLGNYDEIVVAEVARPAGSGTAAVRTLLRGHVGIHVSHMPVSEVFTCEAGRRIWGYPKTVDELEVDLGAERARATWDREGSRILELRVRRGGAPVPAAGTSGVTYTTREATLLRTSLRGRFGGITVRSGGAGVRLGAGAGALGLDALDLGGRALASVTAERIEMTFDAARPVDSTR